MGGQGHLDTRQADHAAGVRARVEAVRRPLPEGALAAAKVVARAELDGELRHLLEADLRKKKTGTTSAMKCLVLWFCVPLCVAVTARLASTHTALVSQSLVGLCFAFPSINQAVHPWLFFTFLPNLT